MQQVQSYRQSLRALRDSRFLAILLFGFCSGFPHVLHGSVLTLWLQESGFSRSAIGFIGAIGAVYALNWIWAPFIDRLRIPVLFKRFGQRRSWIVLCQMLIAVFIATISFFNPTEHLLLITLLALLVAIASATMDISIDAYRITIFDAEEMDAKMPYAAAMSTAGWWAGYGFIGGALALALGGETIGLDWSTVYFCLALIYVVLIGLMLLTPVPVDDARALSPDDSTATERVSVRAWIDEFVIGPFREFFSRCGFQLAAAVLLLLMVFRLGEAMLGRMSLVFYVEVGFTTDEISFYQKFFGGVMVACFSILGAMVNTRFGVIKGLFVAGIAMAGANLLYALLAVVGPDTNLLMVALLVDNFFMAFSTVAFVSFISYFTSRTYTGTQYALMASISNFGRTTLSSGSGAVVDFLNGDWATFFVLTTLMVIPGLCLLLWVGKLMKSYNSEKMQPATS
jgi:PAT family beta-lactamase induction signal transducer AmpG